MLNSQVAETFLYIYVYICVFYVCRFYITNVWFIMFVISHVLCKQLLQKKQYLKLYVDIKIFSKPMIPFLIV